MSSLHQDADEALSDEEEEEVDDDVDDANPVEVLPN